MTPQAQAQRLAEEFILKTFSFRDGFGNQVSLCAYDLGYRFKFNNKKRAVGTCSYRFKTIELSLAIIKANPELETVENTIRHEIAHAFAKHIYGTRTKGHDRYWKHTARACGANDVAGNKTVVGAAGKYTVFCKAGHEFPRHKRPTTLHKQSCAKCSNKYNPTYSLEYKQNY